MDIKIYAHTGDGWHWTPYTFGSNFSVRLTKSFVYFLYADGDEDVKLLNLPKINIVPATDPKVFTTCRFNSKKENYSKFTFLCIVRINFFFRKHSSFVMRDEFYI